MSETIIKRKPGRPKGSGKNNSSHNKAADALRRKPGRPRINPPSRLVPIPVTEDFYAQHKQIKLGRPCYYEPWMCDKLMEVYANGGHLVQACIALGVRDEDTIREWRQKFPEFEEAWQWALKLGRAHDEALLEAAINGRIHGYQATAHAIRLNSRYSEDFKRPGAADSGTTNNTININTIDLTPQQLNEKIQQVTQKMLSWGVDINTPVVEADTDGK